MTARRLARPARAAAATAGLTAALLALTVGAAAAASNPAVTRSDGSDATASPTTSNTCFAIVGSVPASLTSKTTTMTVVDPAGNAHSAGSVTSSPTSTRKISFHFATATLSWTDSCTSGGPIAPNGTYTARLSGGVSASASFKVTIPPAAVTGFTGSADGTVAQFAWNPNAEPDLVSYDIRDVSGNDVTPGGLDPASVCDTSGCAVGIDFGPGASGTSRQFVIDALRKDGSGGLIRSADSSPAVTVSFPAAPSPSPSSSGGGSTSATSGGTTSGKRTSSSGKTGGSAPRTLSGKHPAAELRAYLPSTLAGGAPDLPSVVTEVKPLPQGTYKPTLAYPDQVSKRAYRKQEAARSASLAGDITKVFDEKALWRSLGGAALLLLVAAHLRAWLARTRTD